MGPQVILFKKKTTIRIRFLQKILNKITTANVELKKHLGTNFGNYLQIKAIC